MDLKEFGLDTTVQQNFDRLADSGFGLARITAVNKNNFMVRNAEKEVYAELTGKFLYDTVSTVDFPTVGDWVVVQFFDDDSLAIIHQILPRKSVLKRKTAGKNVDFQLIAANIDTAFIMQSVDRNFNLNRLERYLIMVTDENIEPVILLSKSDLLESEGIDNIIKSIETLSGKHTHILLSNVSGEGVDQLTKRIFPGKTYCLLGSSGVGKTTLLNKIIGEDMLRVESIREKDGRGRHTTTRRQLIHLPQGGLFIDTPGMRELANFDVEKGMSETFSDIYRLVEKCRFSDCMHTNEKDCAVKAAVVAGEIEEKRYQNFMKILKESAYYEMSHLEKRQRDKKFGKMVKQVMKNHKKR